jgi:hypothetical protein
MTKGSLIEYQALKIAKLEQENEQLRIAIAAQLYGNSGACVLNLRTAADKYRIEARECWTPVAPICISREELDGRRTA